MLELLTSRLLELAWNSHAMNMLIGLICLSARNSYSIFNDKERSE
jgi:hypothetical protein